MDSQQFLDDALLQRRIEEFYGYGNYEGKYWFVGMEERGAEDFEDVNCRINTWAKRGYKEIDDVAEYHIEMGNWDKGISKTWNRLIRILFSAKGTENIDVEDVKEYQFSKLARKNQETCLLELLPLPAQNINDWIYDKYSKLTFLSTRKTFKKYCVGKRINHIREKIKEYQPLVVVFYGMKYQNDWRKVTDVSFSKIEFSKREYFFIGENGQTLFLLAKHPADYLKDEYFHNIGKSIAAKLAE